MTNIALPHDSWVLVGDGRKALLFRNHGDEKFPNLKTVNVFANPDQRPTHEQGTDRPGRASNGIDSRRGAMEQADWHRIDEERFAEHVTEAIMRLMENGTIRKLILVAPPRTLAAIRKRIPKHLHHCIFAEVDKDLTKHPVYEIERVLSAAA